MSKWWKVNSSGQYELKTLQDLAQDSLQQCAKSRKMCYELNSLEDIPKVVPQLQKVRVFARLRARFQMTSGTASSTS